jgi:hypothetical protein
MLSKKRFACKDTMENGKLSIGDTDKLIQCLHTLASQIGIPESNAYSDVEEDIFESFKSNIQKYLEKCLAGNTDTNGTRKGNDAKRKCVNDTITGMKENFKAYVQDILHKPENREKTDDSLIFGRIIKNMEYARRDFLKTKKLYRKLSDNQRKKRKDRNAKRRGKPRQPAVDNEANAEALLPRASYHSPYQIYSNMNRNVAYR